MTFSFEDIYPKFPPATNDTVRLVGKEGIGGYVAIGLIRPGEKDWVACFTLNTPELLHLIKELQELVEGKTDYAAAEGITLGGPPKREDLMEYRTKDE